MDKYSIINYIVELMESFYLVHKVKGIIYKHVYSIGIRKEVRSSIAEIQNQELYQTSPPHHQ